METHKSKGPGITHLNLCKANMKNIAQESQYSRNSIETYIRNPRQDQRFTGILTSFFVSGHLCAQNDGSMTLVALQF